jgi:predicted RNA binding protein YcfA (HicA-like mRNA interferase family)
VRLGIIFMRCTLGFLSDINMPKKIRDLKAMLHNMGFFQRPGKGSHTVWEHPILTNKLTISGRDGDDAKPYQEKQVRDIIEKVQNILRKLREVQE